MEQNVITYNLDEFRDSINKVAMEKEITDSVIEKYIDFYNKCEEKNYPMSKNVYDSLIVFSYDENELNDFIKFDIISESRFDERYFGLYLNLKNKYDYVGGNYPALIKLLKKSIIKDVSYDELLNLIENSNNITELNDLIDNFVIEEEVEEEVEESDLSTNTAPESNSDVLDNQNNINELTEIINNVVQKSLNDSISNINSELGGFKAQLKDSISEINNKISSSGLEQKISFLESENRKLQDELNIMSNKFTISEQFKDRLSSENVDLKAEIRQFKKEYKEKNNECVSLRSDNNRLIDENKVINDILSKKNQEIDKLNELLEKEKNKSNMIIENKEEHSINTNNSIENKVNNSNTSKKVNYSNIHTVGLSNIDLMMNAENSSVSLEQGQANFDKRMPVFKKIKDYFVLNKFSKMPVDEQKNYLFKMLTSPEFEIYDKTDNRKRDRIMKIKNLMDNGFDNILIYKIIYQGYKNEEIDELLNYKPKQINEANNNIEMASVISSNNGSYSSSADGEEVVNDEDYDE